jgi:hypothetical protein
MTDLRERFDRDLADLRPPRGLESAVLTRGRRLRTRRRAGQAGGALVAMAAGAVVTVAVLGGAGDTPTDPGRFATDPPPVSSPDATRPQPIGWWSMPAKHMLAVLEDALPDGVTVTASHLFMETETGLEKATGSLSGILTAETGPGAFQILLYPPQPEAAVPAGQGGEPTFAWRMRCRPHMTTCSPLLDESGTVVGRVSTDTEQGTTYTDAFVLGPDGGALAFYVADSSGEKPGYEDPSASEPPLTTDQLVALARDADWTSYVPKD